MKKFFLQPTPGSYSNYGNRGNLGIDEANDINHQSLFNTLVSYHDTWNSNDCLPLLLDEVEHILLPFEYSEHQDINAGAGSLEELVTTYVNLWHPKPKYILSCDKDFYYASTINEFTYDEIDYAVEAGGNNSHFMVVNSDKSKWSIFYPRFPFIIMSKRANPHGDMGKDFLELGHTFFKNNASMAFQSHSREFRKYFNSNFIPRLPGYSEIEI